MLKLSAAAVRNLDADFRRSREKARELLHIWMEMEGNAATVKNLERALMGIGKKSNCTKTARYVVPLFEGIHAQASNDMRKILDEEVSILFLFFFLL